MSEKMQIGVVTDVDGRYAIHIERDTRHLRPAGRSERELRLVISGNDDNALALSPDDARAFISLLQFALETLESA